MPTIETSTTMKERIRIDPNAISANFMILEDEDQDEALDGREGEKCG